MLQWVVLIVQIVQSVSVSENSKWTNGCEKSDIMMYMFHNLPILSAYYENNTEIKQGVAGN